MNADPDPAAERSRAVWFWSVFGVVLLNLGIAGWALLSPGGSSSGRAAPAVTNRLDPAPVTSSPPASAGRPGSPEPGASPVPPAARKAGPAKVPEPDWMPRRGGAGRSPAAMTVAGDGPRIRGQVRLRGTPPPEKPITALLADPVCSRYWDRAPLTRNYVIGTNGGLGDVVVSIVAGLEGKSFPVPGPARVLEARACRFEPPVIAVMTGQPLQLQTADSLLLNVTQTGSTNGNPGFNVALAPGGRPVTVAFARPEMFLTVDSAVHSWMRSHVCVVGHPFFAVTDAAGAFELPSGLPPGTYTLELAHRRAGSVRLAVSFSGVADASVAATLEAPR